MLCRNLDAQLAAVDFDRVESKNLLAQAYVKQSVGKNKAEALKLQLLNFHGTKVDAFGVKVTAANVAQLAGNADLIVDCFDNLEGRAVLSTFARAQGKALVHAGVAGDGTFGIVRWDERFAPDPEDHAGQATCEGGVHLPLIGVLSATLARAVQDFVTKQERRDAMVTLTQVTPTT
jgi:molybdopterin/thiamine biosynthesis adenylyltransferase